MLRAEETMSIDERLRWEGFWILDRIKGGHVRAYYEEIRDGFRNGTSAAGTEEKIRKLIRHAVRTTDFYKDYSEDCPLEKMPLVDKETFRNQYSRFESAPYRDLPTNRLMSTSGSTGTPLTMVQDQNKIWHNTAGGLFLGVLGGFHKGEKQAFIRVWVNNVRKKKINLFIENQIMMDSSSLSDESIQKMLDIIKRQKVKELLGYSSALEMISRYISEHNVDMSGFCVHSIIPISENMDTNFKRALEKQFNCTVQSWYSNEENGIMGIQKPYDESYYIDSESYHIEILKMDRDEPAEPGELGRIVITDLYNYAFPIIRYENGDVAKARRIEKNGRYRLYLTQLYGRRSDTIYDTQGNALTPYIITNNLWDVKGVKQYRFIQEDVARYTLWLNGDREQMDTEDIKARILPYFGEGADIRIEFVDEIPVLRSGKRKYIENRCEKYLEQVKSVRS